MDLNKNSDHDKSSEHKIKKMAYFYNSIFDGFCFLFCFSRR